MSLEKFPKNILIISCFIWMLSLALVNDRVQALTCTPCADQLCACCDTCTGACCGQYPACITGTTIQGQICCEDWNTMTDCDWLCCGGCFTGETQVGLQSDKETEGQSEEIKNLKPGDVVSSFDAETGEISEGSVSDIKKTSREGYYELETESGKRVKVTAEHPFLAVKGENAQIPNSKFQIVDKFKKILSNTLTYNLITSLQAKINAALK